MRILLVFFTILLLVLDSCSPKQSANWAVWRGPNVSNVSPDTGLNYEKLDSAFLLWKIDIGFGHSAISVIGDHCFATGWKETISETDTIQQSTIYCLDVKTGKEIWTYKYDAAECRFPGPRSTPVVDGDKLYSIGWEGKLFCLNVNDGSEIWKLNLAADSLATWDNWGFNTSPVISNNLLLLNLDRTGLALDKNTGEVVWRGKSGINSWSTVYLLNIEGEKYGIFSADTSLYLVNVENGEVESTYRHKLEWTVNDDIVLLPGNRIYTGNEMLQMKGKLMEPIWSNDSIASFFRTGVVVGDFSYQFCDVKGKNFLDCIDLKTGAPMWRQKMPGRWGNLMAVGEYLVGIETFGKVFIAEANPKEYVALKELQVLDSNPLEENFCWVAPTFVNGRLFIRNSKGELACIDLSK